MKQQSSKGRGKGRNSRSLGHGLALLHKIQALADQLTKITHFTTDECKALIVLHQKLEAAGPLDRMRMREVLHVVFEITDDVMLDLAFKAFDRDNDNFVDDVEWVQGLSTMLRGTTEELSDWCYYIYDMNGDGGLAREELSHCLKGCILPGYGVESEEIDDCERDIVEITMRKLDVDKDGQITLTDFKNAVREDPLLLVSVGPCLPPVKCCAAFLALVTDKFRSYTGALGREPRKPGKYNTTRPLPLHKGKSRKKVKNTISKNASKRVTVEDHHEKDESTRAEFSAKKKSMSVILQMTPGELQHLRDVGKQSTAHLQIQQPQHGAQQITSQTSITQHPIST